MYCAIDIGTSFIKTAFLEDGKVIGEVRKFSMTRVDTGFVYDYEYDLDSAIVSLKDWIEESLELFQPEGILLSTQMHGFLIRREGRISPYISWQDERSLQPLKNGKSTLEVLRETVPSDLIRRGGVNLKSELALCGLLARTDEPHKENGELFTLGSYVIYSLTGRNVTHETNAAPTGLYDIYQKKWNTDLISLLGLENLVLPETVEAIRPVGKYKGIPVYPDLGDQQATLLGIGLKDDTLNINIGTASQMTMICSEAEPQPTAVSEIRPYLNGKYIRVVSKLPGGRSLQVLMDFFKNVIRTFTGQELPNSAMWDTVDRFPCDRDTDLGVKLGFFPMLLFPEGSFSGITGRNLTVESVMESAYRNMADSYQAVTVEFDLTAVREICISSKFAPAIFREFSHRPEFRELSFREATAAEAALEGLFRSLR